MADKPNPCWIETYTSKRASGGPHRWRMKAGNGEILATGEGYHNKADRANAIQLIIKACRGGLRIQMLD